MTYDNLVREDLITELHARDDELENYKHMQDASDRMMRLLNGRIGELERALSASESNVVLLADREWAQARARRAVEARSRFGVVGS